MREADSVGGGHRSAMKGILLGLLAAGAAGRVPSSQVTGLTVMGREDKTQCTSLQRQSALYCPQRKTRGKEHRCCSVTLHRQGRQLTRRTQTAVTPTPHPNPPPRPPTCRPGALRTGCGDRSSGQGRLSQLRGRCRSSPRPSPQVSSSARPSCPRPQAARMGRGSPSTTGSGPPQHPRCKHPRHLPSWLKG